jgi:hypothetical protein
MITHDPKLEEFERQEREFFAGEEARKREHTLEVTRVKATTASHDTTMRSLAKAGAWFVLAFWIPVLLLCKITVPQFLQDFMNL